MYEQYNTQIQEISTRGFSPLDQVCPADVTPVNMSSSL